MSQQHADMQTAKSRRQVKTEAKKARVVALVKGDPELTIAAIRERTGNSKRAITDWLHEAGVRACGDSEVMGCYGTGAKAARMRRAKRSAGGGR